MITGGYFSTGAGLSLLTIGLMTDPSEKNDEIMKTMPTDLSEILTKPLDIILENDNNQIENAVSTILLIHNLSTFKVGELTKTENMLKFAGFVSDTALYGWDACDTTSQNQTIQNAENVEN